MEVFDDLWNKREQYVRAPIEGFEMFTMEEWIQHSSTYKILTGSFRSPLPPELEKDQISKTVNSTASNSNVLDVSSKTSSVNTIHPDAPKDPVKIIPQTSFPISTTSFASTSTPSLSTSPRKLRPENSKQEDNVLLLRKHVPGGLKWKYCRRKSSLTFDEQRDCLNFFTKFRNRKFSELTGVEKAEFQLYQSLQLRVKEEQEEFLRMARSEWPNNMKQATTLHNNHLLKYTKDLWRDRVKRALGLYKHQYKQVRSVPLMKDREKHFTLTLERPLLQIGSIPVARFPDFGDLVTPYRTTSQHNKLRAWSFLNLSEKETAGSLHKVPVSADPNADQLARLHAADVVLSSSGFKTLLDNHPANQETNPSGFNRTWCLPVIVKEHRAFENGVPVMKKIIYIDKALPNSQMSGTDYVRLYYKYGFQSSTIRRDYSPAKEFDIKGAEFLFHNNESIKSECKPFEQSQNDSFASVSASPKLHQQPALSVTSPPKSPQDSSICSSEPMSSVKGCTLKEGDNDMEVDAEQIDIHDDNNGDDGDNNSSDDDENKLLIDWEDKSSEEEVICKSKVVPNKACRSDPKIMCKEMPLSTSEIGLQEVPPPNSDKVTKGTENSAPVDRPGSPLTSTPAELSKENQELIKAPSVKVVNGYALPLNVTNVTYNLWSLAPQEQHEVVSRQPPSNLRAIRAIVRCRIDACEQVNRRVEPLHLACKPEFQFEYGAEVESLSQLTRQWANLLIRPDTQLARGRVNVLNHELVMVERRSLTDIALEAKEYHRVSLPDSLHTLYSVFTNLLTLPCGEYLLMHKPQDGAFARLLTITNIEDSLSLNLAKEYKGGPKVLNSTVPWPPLDPSIVLPRNEALHTMPCMFPPCAGQKFKLYGKPKKINIVTEVKKIPSKSKNRKRKHRRPNKKVEGTCFKEEGELEASSTEPTTEVG